MPENSLRPARILVGCIHGGEGIEAAAYRIKSQPLIVIFDNDRGIVSRGPYGSQAPGGSVSAPPRKLDLLAEHQATWHGLGSRIRLTQVKRGAKYRRPSMVRRLMDTRLSRDTIGWSNHRHRDLDVLPFSEAAGRGCLLEGRPASLHDWPLRRRLRKRGMWRPARKR